MSLNDYDSIYFLGIDGIGMGELARWFQGSGKMIAGYCMGSRPAQQGMNVHFDDNIKLIPAFVNKEKTLVIYTPALSKSNSEWKFLKDNGFTIMRRSEVLHLVVKELGNIEDIEKIIV